MRFSGGDRIDAEIAHRAILDGHQPIADGVGRSVDFEDGMQVGVGTLGIAHRANLRSEVRPCSVVAAVADPRSAIAAVSARGRRRA